MTKKDVTNSWRILIVFMCGSLFCVMATYPVGATLRANGSIRLEINGNYW
jgi:hypothetical protein